MKEASNRTAFFSNDVVIPDESGKGIKVGVYPTESAWTWRDITAPISVRGVAATDPSWTRVGSTNMYTYAFSANDFVWQPFHVPHDIVPGSDIFFHTHWFPSDTNTGYVTFEYQYMYAKGFDQEAFDPALANSPLTNAGTVTVMQQAPGTAYQHMVAETAAVTIPTLTEPDGIIYVRMGRIANASASPTWPAYSGTCFVITNDIHYQSTNMGTVGKAPSFYG